MLALLIALLAPPAPAPSTLQARCLDQGHAPSCDRWLVPLGEAAPEAHLRRACAFEAPFSCGLLADKAPRWASVDQRVGWRQIACRVDAQACVTLAGELGDAAISQATRAAARRAAERGCRRWPEVCYALAQQAKDPEALRVWLERACAGRDGRACRDLAWRLERGDGVAADPQRARLIGDRACRQGADDLCLHRLRQRQAAQDHVGIHRACRRGDALSCAARDARRCLRGDPKACQRVSVAPPGACAHRRGECTQTPSLPPYGADGCATVDTCAQARGRQRAYAQRALTQGMAQCGAERGRVQIKISRSGDVYAIGTDAGQCLKGHIKAMQVPPSQGPGVITARLITRDGRPRVHAQVRSVRGAPIPRAPLDHGLLQPR